MEPHPVPSTLTRAVELLSLTAGIYASYILYGLLQERIYGNTYGGERFVWTWFLLIGQCVLSAFAAFLVLIVQKQPLWSKAPAQEIVINATSYIGAMAASTTALQYVDFPTQALAKSTKMIPVMVRRIFYGKIPKLHEALCVLMVTAGISVFMLIAEGKKKSSVETSVIGLLLLLLSLALDADTGPRQESIQEKYGISAHQMMLALNVVASVLCVFLALALGQIVPALEFMQRHTEILPHMMLFCSLAAIGQNFILMMVFNFDPLVMTTVTTTRKFMTILASVIWFGHTLTLAQWGGVGLVFAGIVLNTYFSHKSRQSHGRPHAS